MFAALYAPGNLPSLLTCASHFSPLIEEQPPDAVVFDIRGLRLIFGPPQEIAAEIERRVGVAANIAIASNPDAAVHAARGIARTTVIAPGHEARTLAPLPLFLLGGSSEFARTPDFARTMDLWGVYTFGQFAALPPLGVAERLGAEGALLQRLARGERDRLLKVRGEKLSFQEEKDLECSLGCSPGCSLDTLEPLLLVMAGMLDGLCARVRGHSLAVNEIRVGLKLERAADHAIVLRLPEPMLDPKVLLKLLHLDLNGRPPKAAVEKIRIELNAVEPRILQHGLFLPAAPQPEKLEVTLARIRNLVGAANVGSPELIDTYRPDSFQMSSLKNSQLKTPRGDAAAVATPRLVLRRFRPPYPARVSCLGSGQPARVSSAKGDWRVSTCAGPWFLSGNWWMDESWNREEWDIEVLESGLFRIHQDLAIKQWFVGGSYD